MQLAGRAEQADLLATVRFRTEAEGGRKTAPPAHSLSAIMSVGERDFDVRLRFSNRITPGQQAVVSITFLDPDVARAFVKVGQSFTLRDWRVIAEGTVKSTNFSPG
jgi:hypothetical protein